MSQKQLDNNPAWHCLEVQAVLTKCDAVPQGLAQSEAEQRLRQYGYNRLPEPAQRKWWQRFIEQFNNLLIYILIAAGVMTGLLGHWIDSSVIFGVVLINAIIGVIQEGKAERAIDAIRQMLSLQATVLRNNKRRQISAENLVVGDIVILHPGDKVPADLRLIEVKSLQVQESVLTGESYTVEKRVEPVKATVALAERRSMVYSGTLVTYGRATGVVVAIGTDTEIGRITQLLADTHTLETPLLKQLSTFARWLTLGILILSTLAFFSGVWLYQYSYTYMFLVAVGIAVAAIPEGLPAILTITLAIGVSRMAHRHAIIRRLPAVETMGAVSVICTDKTGTLTCNELTVQTIVMANSKYEVSGTGLVPIGNIYLGQETVSLERYPDLKLAIHAGVFCNEAECYEKDVDWQCHGNPMDGALLILAIKADISLNSLYLNQPRTDLIPFDSQHKFMATLHHDHNGRAFIYVKGAPEIILAMCSHQLEQQEVKPISSASWLKALEQYAALGQRVIAIAYKEVDAEKTSLQFSDVESDCVILGLFGVVDPPRREVISAVKTCHDAGIAVKMITGDHLLTAKAIAEQIGLGNDTQGISGPELDQMSDEALYQCIDKTSVFARTSPEHKLRIVKALQQRNAVVAMTGDGVNDAPALKYADVGVAMGIKGTEASKEVSEMVLTDDNFASITAAVEEGRTVYDNIKKAILFILPTNGGEAFTILLALLFGFMLPITPVQILWVNMITAVTLALAIAFEHSEDDVMLRKPREPAEPIFSSFLIWRIVFVASLLVIATFGLFLYERLLGTDLAVARTVAVNMLVCGEIVYVINCRNLYNPGWTWSGLFGSRAIIISIITVFFFQLLYTYLPMMQFVFDSNSLSLGQWLYIGALAAAIFVIVEIEKVIIKRFGLFGLNNNRISNCGETR